MMMLTRSPQPTNLSSIFHHLIIIPIPTPLLVVGLGRLAQKTPWRPSTHNVLIYELIQALCVYARKITFSSGCLSTRPSGLSLFSTHMESRLCLQHPSPTCGVMGHHPTRVTLLPLLP